MPACCGFLASRALCSGLALGSLLSFWVFVLLLDFLVTDTFSQKKSCSSDMPGVKRVIPHGFVTGHTRLTTAWRAEGEWRECRQRSLVVCMLRPVQWYSEGADGALTLLPSCVNPPDLDTLPVAGVIRWFTSKPQRLEDSVSSLYVLLHSVALALDPTTLFVGASVVLDTTAQLATSRRIHCLVGSARRGAYHPSTGLRPPSWPVASTVPSGLALREDTWRNVSALTTRPRPGVSYKAPWMLTSPPRVAVAARVAGRTPVLHARPCHHFKQQRAHTITRCTDSWLIARCLGTSLSRPGNCCT